MLGRSAARWILLVLVTACGEQGYTVTLGGDETPAEDAAGRSPGAAPFSEERDDAAPQTPEVPQSDATSPCSTGNCSPGLLAFSPNDPYRQRRVLRGDTRTGENARSRADCAGLGPDVAYELDLSAFSEPVSAYFHVRAGFDASLAIETGRQEDPFVAYCNEDHTPGVDEAFIAATLEPRPYRIVVDGESADAGGEFELTVELPSPTGRCGATPPNDRCEDAIAIDPDKSVQTFVGTTECGLDQAHSNWECGQYFWDRPPDVFYSLDLTLRTQPTLVHATTRLDPTSYDTILFVTRDVLGECAEPLICSDDDYPEQRAELWANLEPGRYFLGLEGYGSGDFGLRVDIDAEPCLVANDTCQTAQVIEPKLGVQTIRAWPGCGDDSITTICNLLAPTPDIFYWLDLRGFERPVHVRAEALRAGVMFEALSLIADAGGTCGKSLACETIDLWLAPESYYLALDASREQHGPVELTLELDMSVPPPPADCIDERVATCARSNREWCCSGDAGDCALVFESCGLRPEALDCLCATAPECCEGRGAPYECRKVLEECGTFCPDFDRVLTCPE